MNREIARRGALLLALFVSSTDVLAAGEYADTQGIKLAELVKACGATSDAATAFCTSYIWGAVDADRRHRELQAQKSGSVDECTKFLYEVADRGALVERVATTVQLMVKKGSDGKVYMSPSAPASDAVFDSLIIACSALKRSEAKQ